MNRLREWEARHPVWNCILGSAVLSYIPLHLLGVL